MNPIQARDDITKLFWEYWRVETAQVTGEEVAVYWQGVPETDAPSVDQPWARFLLLETQSAQSTLAPVGERLFARNGIAIVQIFAPVGAGSGVTTCEALAMVARNALEGRSTPGGAWFRNANRVLVGVDGPWFQINVTVEFTYDEQR